MLLSYLRQYRTNPSVTSAAMNALAVATMHQSVASALAHSHDSVAAITTIAANAGTRDATVALAAMQTVLGLSKVPGGARAVVMRGGIRSAAAILRAHRHKVDTVASALVATASTAHAVPDLVGDIGRVVALEVVVAMREHPQSIKVLTAACDVLVGLAVSEAGLQVW